MPRYAFVVQYNGSTFSGWQKQPGQLTVQGQIEYALDTLFRLSIPIVGAGRTDTGVHARNMVFHADIPQELSDIKAFLKSMRGLAGYAINIRQVYRVPDTFHARFDAISRRYVYTITDAFDVFTNQFEWVIASGLPYKDQMFKAAGLFNGSNDFASFSKLNPDLLNSMCHVMRSEIAEHQEGRLTYTIEANRFLHSMVRSLVATLVQVGKGQLSIESISKKLDYPEQGNPGLLAPAHALFLDEVIYNRTGWIELKS